MTNALEELNIYNSKGGYQERNDLDLGDLDAELGDDIFSNENADFVDILDEDTDLETFDTNIDRQNQSEADSIEQTGGANNRNNEDSDLDDNLEEELSNDNSHDNSNLQHLDLERGSLIQKEDSDAKYIVVKAGKVSYNENSQSFVREYKVREMNDNKLDSKIEIIKSTEISYVEALEEVKSKYQDLEYNSLDDKDEDLEEGNELEELDSLPEEDVIEEMDYDIEVDSNMNNINTNEEGFEFEEIQEGEVVIDIEQELDEKDILFTENEQEEDIIDELIRNLSDSEKQNRGNIKKIIKLVRNLQFLKYNHSLESSEAYQDLDEDEKIELKKKLKIKTSLYKPLLQKYLKHQYSCKYLIPIINSQPREYYQSMQAMDAIESGESDKLNPEIVAQLNQIEKIEVKYKNNKELDFEFMVDEIDNLLRDKTVDTKSQTQYITRLGNDTMVINNLDVQGNEPVDHRIILGDVFREDALGEMKKIYQSERVNIVGYLQVPRHILSQIKTEAGCLRNQLPHPLIVRHLRESLKNQDYEQKTLDFNSRYKVNEKVKVCIYESNPENKKNAEKITVTGKIVSSRRGFIYLEPDNKKMLKKHDDILEFDTNSKLLKISKVEDIKDKKDTCESITEKFIVHDFSHRRLEPSHLENMLEQIIPSIKQILDREYLELKTILNLEQLDIILDKYGLNRNDLESQNYDRVQKVLRRNHQKIYQKSQVDYAKINRIKANNDKNEKATHDKRMKNDFDFLSNQEIESTEKVYPAYLHRIHSIDSDIERLAWLQSQEDYGRFITYQKILKQMETQKRNMKISDLQGRLQEALDENEKIKSKLEEEERKKDYFQKEENCQDKSLRIVKIYLDENEIRNDNFKKITVDEPFIVGDVDSPINLVKVNDFCILKNPVDTSTELKDISINDQIFRRVKGNDEKEFWSLQSKLNIVDYLKMARARCNRILGVDETPGVCSFSEDEMKCMPDRIERLRRGFENNELLIQKIETLIQNNSDSGKEEILELELKRLKLRGKLNLKNEEEMIKLKAKHLEEMRVKYPVEFDTSESNHFQFLKELEEEFNDPEKRRELLLKIKDTYEIDFIEKPILQGDERELFTQGDFNEAGQRIELTEVMPNSGEKAPIENSQNEVLDAIRHYLQDTIEQERPTEEEEDMADTISNIINSLVKIMGIKIEVEKVTQICQVIVEDKLISKADFINQKYLKKGKAKPKQSKIDSQYENYQNQLIIFFTVSRLLIYLQLNLTNYFMSPYQKCVSSIYGYPLRRHKVESNSVKKSASVKEEMDLTGVNYVSCILDNLKDSGKFWACIEDYNRSKISKKIVGYLAIILENSSLENELADKFEMMEQNKKEMDLIENQYVWHQFRPLLQVEDMKIPEPPVVDLGDTKMNNKAFQNAVKIHQQRSEWISLKIIDQLNNIISSQDIENIKYDPLPIANACCLSKINAEYNYLNFFQNFDKSHHLEKYIEESRNMEFVNQQLKHSQLRLVYLNPTEYRKKYKSFQHQAFLPENEIKKNTDLMKMVFTNYISSGYYYGQKRIYNKDNVCLDTGQTKQEVDDKVYSVQNYHELLHAIHSRNRKTNISPEEKEITPVASQINFKFVWNKLERVLSQDILLEHDYLRDLVETEIPKINLGNNTTPRVWESLEREVKNMQNELLSKLVRNLDKGNIKNIKSILENMENYEKLEILDRKNLDIPLETEDLRDEVKMTPENKHTLENIKYKRLRSQMVKFINNYLLKYLKVLSHKQNIIVPQEKLDDDEDGRNRKVNKALMEIVAEEYESLAKYNNKKCRGIFKNLKKKLVNMEKVKQIVGYEDVVDCQNKVLVTSKFNNKNAYLLLKLIFLYLLDSVIELSSSSKDSPKGKKTSVSSMSQDDDEEDEEELNKFNIGTTKSVMVSNFVFTILKLVEKDRVFTNKYSQNFVEKEIKTKNEESKDRNLYVMELLDLETRRLRNEQTRAGLAQYADLATDFQDVISQEESNKVIFEEYKQKMGSNFNESDFEEYKENRLREERLEREIRKDNEIYETPEGDEELEM